MVMKQAQGPLRRRVRTGVFIAGLVLALSLPSIALAVNTTVFSSLTPAAGSITTMRRPTISVIGFDRYGVKGVGKATMTLDGVPVPRTFRWISGWGFRKFKMTYAVPTNLSLGSHKVVVRIQDRRGLRSRKTWDFTVDAPPVTTSNALTSYTGTATINLSATDNVAVANTFYWLDSGAPVSGTVITVSTIGSHLLRYWSVDTAGNVEETNWRVFAVTDGAGGGGGGTGFSHAAPAIACTVSGCHDGGDVATIHLAAGCAMCHGTGVTPTTNCITCHGTNPPNHSAATHPSIVSTGDPSCSQAGCHGSAVVTIHTGGCAVCHGTSNPLYNAAIESGNASCESCHPQGFDAIHGVTTAVHAVTGSACFNAACHPSSAADIHTAWATPPGCVACHAPGVTPSLECSNCHDNIATVHGFVHANATGALSSACTECHGTDLPTVHAAVGCVCHSDTSLVDQLTPLLLAGMAECVDCHGDIDAAHGFAAAVSGHNTTTYGNVGAYTKWDGSEGVVVKDSTNSTITQDWPLPTGAVFWSQVDPTKADPTTDSPTFIFGPTVAAQINTEVGWGSVVTCQDCHTGLDSSMGPQGANMGEVGLDPAFPDDWKTAEITSFDPTGMRSIATTAGAPNRFYSKLGSRVWPPEGSSGTTNTTNVWKNGALLATATIDEGGFYATTATSSNGYSSGAIEGRYICQKCHKLASPFQGVSIEGNARGLRSNNFAYMGFSNEVHMEHHGDTINGQGNCISCHIGIPHGWKRPRLLVYESDPAPYKVDQLPLNSTVVANGISYPNAGNWAYFANTGTNGWMGSSHLEAVNAASTAHKENAEGIAGEFAPNDVFNGTMWGNWSTSSFGILWHPDTNVVDGLGLGQPLEGHEIQNNCVACTAVGATHSDPSTPTSQAPTGTREGFTPATSAPVPTTPGNYLAPAWE